MESEWETIIAKFLFLEILYYIFHYYKMFIGLSMHFCLYFESV